MPVGVGVGLVVAGDRDGGRVDVAVLLRAEVELEVRPVRGQGLEDLVEFVGQRAHLRGIIRATPPASPDPESEPDPLAPARGLSLAGLLELLERLDGAEEATVVRAALAAGVPAVLVTDELQREVERRLLRRSDFYDDSGW